MPGPKPRPDEIKRLEGEPNKKRYNPNSPKPPVSRPDCPRHLSDVAKKEWLRICPELEALGLLSQVDRAVLAAYCEAYSEWVKASNRMKRESMTITTTNGNIIQNPMLGIKHKAAEHMHKFLTEFGMSPSSRHRLNLAVQAKSPAESGEDWMDDLLEQSAREAESKMRRNRDT